MLDLPNSNSSDASTRQRPQQMHAVSAQPSHKRARSHDGDDEPGGFDYECSIPAPSAAQPRSHQQRVERRDESWRMQREELLFRSTCAQSQRADDIAQQRQQMLDDWEQRLAAACQHCPHCAATDCLQACPPAADDSNALAFVSLTGHIMVAAPWYSCSSCDAAVALHPSSLGAFPATPVAPMTLYDEQLVAFTSMVQLRAPIAMSAWTEALTDVHVHNGFGAAAPAAYSNLGSALAQWRMVQTEAASDAALGIQPVSEGEMCQERIGEPIVGRVVGASGLLLLLLVCVCCRRLSALPLLLEGLQRAAR